MTLNANELEHVLVEDLDGIREHGETYFYEAKVSDEAGKPVGQLLAEQVIVDLPGEDGKGNPTVEERFTTLAFIFDDGDEIMTMGAFVYPANERLMQANVPQMRTIIGGTGKYKGIRGQMKSTRNQDETYINVLEYKLD
jgi:hypothetical protein